VGKGIPQKPLVREFSAGGVVFKDKGKLWLIINPSRTDRWQLPKGQIEKSESSKQAAEREVKEEAGVNARIISKLGEQKYFYVWQGQKIFKTVVYYLMEFVSQTESGHDHEVDEVAFLSFKEAQNKLTFTKDKEFLETAKEELGKGFQENLL
jgi:8-oxo-dGTP pyrophosphatase MutT (NUDIX family)